MVKEVRKVQSSGEKDGDGNVLCLDLGDDYIDRYYRCTYICTKLFNCTLKIPHILPYIIAQFKRNKERVSVSW